MTWIKVIEEHEAEGELKEAYDFIKRQRGKFGNVLKLHSLNPKALRLGADFMWWLMRGESGVSTAQREMIATAVSATANCRY